MAEKNEYFTQKLENGTLQISEDVVASVEIGRAHV